MSLPLVLAVGFIVFVLFFNENSYSKSLEYQEAIDALRAEIKDNVDTMEYYRGLNERLDTDPGTLERVVREEYHFQRSHEDVYVFE